MTTELALQAVKNALISQRPAGSITLHGDLGSRYTSSDFQSYISKSKILTHSFSAKG
jgi:putative transposase